jgi:hypothetical protein
MTRDDLLACMLNKGLNTPYHKKPACYKMFQRALELDQLAQDRDHWQAVVNIVMNLWSP